MKKLTYILFTSVILLTTGCTEDYELDPNIQLPSYVAFGASGVNVTLDDEPINTNENGGVIDLNVEVPGGTNSDVTVNYSFGGNAVYGVDFTTPGGSASGGSVTIEALQSTDPAIFNFFQNADIEVTLLKDDVVDGTKTLTVTLESASNAEGALAVGRGGTDLLKTQTIVIADFCELIGTKIVGNWTLDMQDSFGDGWNGAAVTVEIDGVETDYVLDDFSTDGGSTGTATIVVPAGTATMSFSFVSGSFDEEVSFQITGPNGVEVGSFTEPAAGTLDVDACLL